MRIIVTGGCGFLGAHLCSALLDDGAHVICMDDLSTGRLKNVAILSGHPRFTFVKHDVSEPFNFPVEQIYNLACIASPLHYMRDPIKTMRTSVYGAMNVSVLAEKENATVLQASTSEIYGDSLIQPLCENNLGNVDCLSSRACYQEGKRAAEALLKDFSKTRNVNVKIVRIFNTYGPRMALNDGRLISNLLVQSIKGKDLTIYGDGKQTRSFCFVDDLIDGLILLMNSSSQGPINLGNPEELSVLRIAELIRSKAKTKIDLKFLDKLEDDPLRRKPAIELAQKELNWSPKISFDDGLEITRKYFKNALKSTKN